VTYASTLESGPDTGRYHGVDNQEEEETVRLNDAMARMKLLDSRLNAATKKDLQLKHDLSSRSRRADNDDDADSEAPTSGRLSARSVGSVASSRSGVFLTRARSEKTSSIRGTSTGSAATSPQHSARSTVVDSAPVSPTVSELGSVNEELDQKPAIKAFIAPDKKKGSLNDEDELRLQTLLDVDENGEEWKELSKYGLSAAQRDRLTDIDDELEQYGHSNRNFMAESVNDNHLLGNVPQTDDVTLTSVPGGASGYDDFLSQQRKDKETKSANTALDMHLQSVRTAPDLSSLVDKTMAGGCSSVGATLMAVPDFSNVPAARKVTTADLSSVIAYLRQHVPQSTDDDEDDNGLPPLDSAPSLDDDASIATIQVLAETGSTAGKRDIDRLLSSLRPEINRLADLRNSLESVMEGVSRREDVGDKKTGGGTTATQAALRVHDDELEDIQMRYGLQNQIATPDKAASGAVLRPSPGQTQHVEPERDPMEIRRRLEMLKLSKISKRAAGGDKLRAEMGLSTLGQSGVPNARQAAAWIEATHKGNDDHDDDELEVPVSVSRKVVI
jgi:hypothetical protein